MKKFLVVFLLGLLIAGSAFAQWGNDGYAQPTQPQQAPQTTQTVSGTLHIINGIIAIVSADNQVYYVSCLQPWYGANGLFLNAYVTVYGTITNNCINASSFVAGGKWYILPGCNNNVVSAKPMYGPSVVVVVVPMYTPQQGYYRHDFGW